jgi:hypothetical protein
MNRSDITAEQATALEALYHRHNEDFKTSNSLEDFFATAYRAFGSYIMVPYAGMILGIEEDGYTHS